MCSITRNFIYAVVVIGVIVNVYVDDNAINFFKDKNCDVIILGCTHFLNISKKINNELELRKELSNETKPSK